jgi:hypothetical protein
LLFPIAPEICVWLPISLLKHFLATRKKPVETRKNEMYIPVVTGGSGEHSKTIMIKEEDLQTLFHKMMRQTKQEFPTKTFQRPNAIPNTNKDLCGVLDAL